MAEKLTGNQLPHNPLQGAGVLEELKKLKGDKPWIQFELELLSKVYPTNKVFTAALGKLTAKAAPALSKQEAAITASSKPVVTLPAIVTKVATKMAPQSTTKGKGKTLAEVQSAKAKGVGNTEEGKQMLNQIAEHTADESQTGDLVGSPNAPVGGTAQTFHAIFEMSVIKSNHNLIRIGKRQYRNPIYLAKEWREALDRGEYPSPAGLARSLKISRARVTQLLNLLKLPPEVSGILMGLGDPLAKQQISERSLRKLLQLSIKGQIQQALLIVSKIP